MNEQSAPDFPLPYPPEQHPPKKTRRRYMQFVRVFVAVSVVLAGIVSAYLWTSKSNTTANDEPTTRSFTYYYRDGQTVLWQGMEPYGSNSPAFVYRAYGELVYTQGAAQFEGNGDWKITTTLDKSLQETAEQQLKEQTTQLLRQGGQDSAMMAQDITTGQIVSWVTGQDNIIPAGGVDRLSSKTEAGTLVLPLVYAADIENNGVNADTIVDDSMGPLPGYLCTQPSASPQNSDCLQNFDRQYWGPITLRQALGNLRLVPAAKAMAYLIKDDTSPDRVNSINKTIGVIESLMGNEKGYSCYLAGTDTSVSTQKSEEVQCYLASAIGAGAYATPQNILQAYATLANGGKQLQQTGILKLERNGKLLGDWKASDGKQVVEADTANIINDILSDQDATYMARKSWYRIGDHGGTKVSVVGGFNSDALSAGAIQYTSKYVAGFWIFGGEDPSKAIKGFAETIVLPPLSGWLTAAK